MTDLGGLDERVAFVTVAEAGSFTAAAKSLGRDASVLSRRIGQLEERLGVRLLARTTRRVVLTEVGEIYFRRMQAVLEELANADRAASDYAGDPRGLLRVSIPVVFGRQWIAPMIPAFLARYPEIRLDLRLSDRFVDVVAEAMDVTIRVTAGPQRDSSLNSRKIAAYRNLLVASPGYLTERGAPDAPTDLLEHACLGFTGSSAWPDWPLMKGDKRQTIRPRCAMIADHSEVLLDAAIAGAGIAFTPDWLAGPALRTGALVEVLPGWSGKEQGGVYAIMAPGRLMPAKTRLFVDEVATAIKAGWVG